MSPIEWDGEIYRSRDELARRVTPIVSRSADAVAMALPKIHNDVADLIAFYKAKDGAKNGAALHEAVAA